MGFINIRITPFQREELAKKNIENPLCPKQLFVPYFGTVDYERNAFLFNVGSYHDLPEETLFIFLLNSTIFLLTLEMRNIDSKTKEWIFLKSKVIDGKMEFDEFFLINIFREALSEYKYNGLPNNYEQQFNMIINF